MNTKISLVFIFIFFATRIHCNDVLDNLKHVLMYLTEPSIVGESFSNVRLEGSFTSKVIPYLDEIMEKKLSKVDPESNLHMEKLMTFQASLRTGFQIFNEISGSKMAIEVQNFVLKKLEDSIGEWIYIPTYWSGFSPHAIVIGICKKTGSLYDLAVINSGDGTQFHYSEQDPNGINPVLTKLWVDFKNIPESEIFDETAWFIEGLKRTTNLIFCLGPQNMPLYFYGSFLTNLRDFLSADDNKLLDVSQRSRSCVMSSLLGALLHHCQDRELFFLNRLLLGQEILSDFLEKFKDNSELKTILSDGLELFERNIFSSIPAGLANFTIQYLEEAYPDHFKNSILIGPDHSNWLIKKKKKAIEKLGASENQSLIKLLISTIELGTQLMQILTESPIDYKTTSIIIDETKRNSLEHSIDLTVFKSSFVMGTTNIEMSDPYKDFTISVSRPPKTSISSLKELIYRLNLFKISITPSSVSNVLDLFKAISNEKWWEIIEISESIVEIDELLELIEWKSRHFLKAEKKIRSLDNIVFLACLQLAGWKAAQAKDRLLNHPLGLKDFGPPLGIQKFISLDRFYLEKYKLKYVWSNFDAKNLKFLHLIIDELNNNEGKELFAGPFELTNNFIDATNIDLKDAFSKMTVGNKAIYKKIENLNETNVRIFLENNGSQMENRNAAVFSFILSQRDKFNELTQHFHQLLNTLFNIFWAVQPDNWTQNHANDNLCTNQPGAYNLLRCYFFSKIESIVGTRYDVLFDKDVSSRDILPAQSQLQFLFYSSSKKDIFFDAREVDAFGDDYRTIVILETWLNYVKGALNSDIFDSPKFQFVSDYLLNVPKISFNAENTFDISPNSTYPKGFEKRHVIEIYESLFSFIKEDLNLINLKSHILEIKEKSKIIEKVVNISIILTRFLERIENDKFVSGTTTAIMLGNLYLELSPFGLIKRQHVLLADEDISSINLVLGYICYFDLRNGLTFYNLINKFLNIKPGIESYRRSLARMHMFLYKFTWDTDKSSLTLSMKFDLIDVGFQYLDIKESKIEFMNELFKILFLKRIAPNATWNSSFKYTGDGLIGEVTSKEGRKISAHFAEGLVIIDNMPVVKKSTIINSVNFEIFFPEEFYMDALNGEAFRIGSLTIYVLKNFRNLGINFIFISNYEKKGGFDDYFKIFREYNGEWYLKEFYPSIYPLLHLSELEIAFKNYRSYSRITKPLMDGQEYHHKIVNLDFTNDLPIFEAQFITNSDFGSSAKVEVKIQIGDTSLNCKLIQNKLKIPQFKFFGAGSDGVCQKENGKMVYIFSHLRFKDDLKHPIVINERDNLVQSNISEFDLVNIPGYVVEADQSVDKGTGLKSTLKVRNQENEQKLLVPVVQRRGMDYNPNLENDDIIVEIIPINNHKLCPQNRTQILLLVFYAILNYNFNLARQLLHPDASFHQNEVFDSNELKFIRWILEIETKNPETVALKMFILIHLNINKSKFLFDYNINSQLQSVNNILHESIEIEFKYLKYMRELPMRYHFTRIFGELNDKDFFYEAFGGIKSLVLEPSIPIPYCDSKQFVFLYNERIIKQQSFSSSLALDFKDMFSIFDICYDKDPSAAKKKQELKLMTKLFKKQRGADGFNPFSFNMAAYCVLNDDEGIWNTAYDFAKTSTSSSINEDWGKWYFNDALTKCVNKYQEKFKIISQNSGVNLNIELFYNSIVSSEMEEAPEDSYEMQEDLVDSDEINAVTKYINVYSRKLDSFKEQKTDASLNSIKYFDFKGKSNVLSKLMKSIENYFKENDNYPIIIKDEELELALTDLRTFLANRLAMHVIKLKNMNKELAKQTIYYSKLDANYVIGNLIQLMHGKKFKLFKNLYSCYQKSSLKCFQKKFPLLSREECRELWKTTEEFYKRSVLINYINFLIQKIDSLYDSYLVEDLQIFAEELDKIFDFNKRTKDKTVLNFEFMSQRFRLKPEQVEDIDLLTERTKDGLNFKSIVIQRMMAAGKSLVLGTIAVVKKASLGKSLSILVPPSSLYQSNTISMQTRTYSYFKKLGKAIHFPRLSPNLKTVDLDKFLKFALKSIELTMKDRNYLILSPGSLHSFLNSYIEHLNYASVEVLDKNSFKILKYFAKIYKIFQEHGTIILDEIDMTLDPKKEVNFPTFERETYNMTAVTLIADLIEFATFDKQVMDAGLDILGNNQSKLSQDEYNGVKIILLNYIEEKLYNSSSIWHTLLISTLSDDRTINIDETIDFLKNPELGYKKSWIEKIGKSGNETVMEALIIIKMELNIYLKDSLKATANLNYGLAGESRPKVLYAVPYVAANTPSNSSEFADRWETLNKTLLALASTACNRSIAGVAINYVVSSIKMETSDGTVTTATTTYLNVKKLLTSNSKSPALLREDCSEDVEFIFNSLKSRSQTAINILFRMFVEVIFSKMDFAIEQISSNALNMVSMFNSVQGYSGTIDNVNILPQNVIEEAYFDHLKNEKNNGSIALKLLNDSLDSVVPEIVVFDNNLENFMTTFMEKILLLKDEINAVIDAGAFFKDFTNREISESFLNSLGSRIKVVLFYDEKTNLLQFVKKSGDKYEIGHISNTDPDSITKVLNASDQERFTFYDHRHITGSDIFQHKFAQAILTVGTRTLLRDIFQGTLRMRQFMSSQRVHMLTNTATRQFLSSRTELLDEVKVSDLLTLGAINEDEKQIVENEKLAFAKIDSEIRGFILKEITNILNKFELDDTTKVKYFLKFLFEKNRSLFVKSLKENTLSWLGASSEFDSKEFFQQYVMKKLGIVTKIIYDAEFIKNYGDDYGHVKNSLENLNQNLEMMISSDKVSGVHSLLNFIGKTTQKSLSNAGAEVEIQLDSENILEALAELNIQNLVDSKSLPYAPKRHENFNFNLFTSDVDKSELPQSADIQLKQFVSLNSILLDPKMSSGYTSLTKDLLLSDGKGVGVTIDLLVTLNTGENEIRPFKIFSNFTQEGSHLLVYALPENIGVRVLLVSTHIAQTIFNDYMHFIEKTFWLCDLSGRVTITNDDETVPGMNILEFIPASRNLIFDALIFNASLNQILSSPILKVLYYKKWLNSRNAISRAKFLLLRATVLFEKFSKTISASNQHFAILNSIINGDSNAKKQIFEILDKLVNNKSMIQGDLLNCEIVQELPGKMNDDSELLASKAVESIFNIISLNSSSETTHLNWAENQGHIERDIDTDESYDDYEQLIISSDNVKKWLNIIDRPLFLSNIGSDETHSNKFESNSKTRTKGIKIKDKSVKLTFKRRTLLALLVLSSSLILLFLIFKYHASRNDENEIRLSITEIDP